MGTTRCSDRRHTGRLVTLEGMPGAGKTTLITALAARGLQTVGEYVTDDGATLAWQHRPAVDDDQAHQRNWILKHRAAHDGRDRGIVVCDRDWVSALAYAASLGNQQLLSERARWVQESLTTGRLCVADNYLVLDLDPHASIARRASRLTPGHPWSTGAGLELLRRFYRDPAAGVGTVHAALGARLTTSNWHILHAPTRDQAIDTAIGVCAAST